MPYDIIENNQLIVVLVKLNHISIFYWVLISIIVNQSSIFGHISAKFAQNRTILNLKNLAKWQSSIWLNLAKFRPSFGYFENFDLATLICTILDWQYSTCDKEFNFSLSFYLQLLK